MSAAVESFALEHGAVTVQRSPRKLVEPTSVSVFVEVKTVSEANRSRHEHWSSINARASSQKEITTYKLRAAYVRCPFPLPLVVKLTRRGARLLDDDNLRGALKAVRDAVARYLEVDDKHSEIVRYDYAQELAGKRPCGVTIEIAPRGEVAGG